MSKRKQEINVMCDFETLDTTPSSVVLSVGLVEFFPETQSLGREFYALFEVQGQLDMGRTISESTLTWWMGQSQEARREAFRESDLLSHRDSVAKVLMNINNFLDQCDGSPMIWGNGAAFDNSILSHLYAQCKISPAYHFTSDRCYRTLKNLVPGLKAENFEGVAHHALDDAKNQARHAMILLDLIKSSLPRGVLK